MTAKWVWGNKNVLELDNDNGGIILWMHYLSIAHFQLCYTYFTIKNKEYTKKKWSTNTSYDTDEPENILSEISQTQYDKYYIPLMWGT